MNYKWLQVFIGQHLTLKMLSAGERFIFHLADVGLPPLQALLMAPVRVLGGFGLSARNCWLWFCRFTLMLTQ